MKTLGNILWHFPIFCFLNAAIVVRLALLLILAMLSACLSSENDSANSASNAPPLVDAGRDSVVGDNRAFSLTGTVSDSDGQIVSLEWKQVSGPAVAIESANSAIASVNPGDLAADATYRFSLTAVDDDGASSSDEVAFLVVDDSSALRVGLGTLSGAQVTVTALKSESGPVFQGTTSDMGIVVIPHEALDSESGVWLVEASGGVDINPNQDGVFNGTSVENASTLRSYFTREQLTRPAQSVSILSDIAWFFSQSQEATSSQADLILRLGDVARVLVARDLNGDGVVDHADLTNFDVASEQGSLGFDFSKLLEPIPSFNDLSLVDAYHQGLESMRFDMLSFLFGGRLSAVPAKETRAESVVVRLAVFGNGVVTSTDPRLAYDADDGGARNDSIVVFQRADATLSLFADPKPGSEVLSWRGCESISSDQRSCAVTLNRDRMVEVLFKYSTPQVDERLADLSAAYTTIDGNGLVSLRIGHQDLALTGRVEGIQPGDFIVGSGGGGFLRRVETMTRLSDYRYEFDTSFAALEDVLTEGTVYFRQRLAPEDAPPSIADSVDAAGASEALQPAEAELTLATASRSVAGFHPAAPGIRLESAPEGSADSFMLVFGETTSIGQDLRADVGIATGGLAETVELRDPDGRKVTINGTATFTVTIEFAASTNRVLGLDYFKIAPEIVAEESIEIQVGGGWASEGDLKVKVGTYRSPKPVVVKVGFLPVYLTPKIDFFVGADGRVSGTLSGGSSFSQSVRAGVVYNRVVGVTPIIDTDFSFDPIGPIAGAEAEIVPYIEPVVGVDIYNIIDGPSVPIRGYVKLIASAVLDSGSSDFWRSPSCAPGPEFNVWIGIASRLKWVLQENLNRRLDTILGEVFADKLTLEFEFLKQEWKLNNWAFELNCPNAPPFLFVSRGEIDETVTVGSPRIISKFYELRNFGDTELKWKISYLEDRAINVSKTSGVLSAGDIDIVTVSVNSAELSLGRYLNLLEFRNADAGILKPDSESGNTDRSVKVAVVASSLPIPMNVSATLDSPNVASLAWGYDLGSPQARDMSGFLIESRSQSNNEGLWARVAYLGDKGVRDYKIADLTTDTVYELRIRAVGESVESEAVVVSLNVPAVVPATDCQAFFSGNLVGDRVEAGWISEIYVVDSWSEYVGAGVHRANAAAFPKAVGGTFDGIAIDAGTRVIIYSEEDFGGEILYDRVGPAVVNNSLWETSEPYASYINGPWQPILEASFPPGVREWSESDMHDWSSGSLVVECGY